MTTTLADAPMVLCPETSEALWVDNKATDFGLEVYSEGDCWALAWYLYLAALEEGYEAEIFTLGALNNWGHVAVKLEGSYWDISGSHSADEMTSNWALPLVPLSPEHCESLGSYMEALDAHYLYEAGPMEAEAVALRLLGQATGWYY